MPLLPRGTCPTCGRDVALRKGDLLREHVRDPHSRTPLEKCAGSGTKAKAS